MEAKIYKTLAKILGVVLFLIGVGAFAGGQFAGSFVGSQLRAQQITMPKVEELKTTDQGGQYSKEDVDALAPFAGQLMSTGDMAAAYADHYIAVHLQSAAKRANVPEDKATFAGIGDVVNEVEAQLADEIKADPTKISAKTLSQLKITAQEATSDENIKNVVSAEEKNSESAYPSAKQASQLNNLKNNTFFQGNMIRGTLLSAYGWGLIGKIANIAGIALIVLGVVVFAGSFAIKSKKE
ncbi:MAG: hypothetical protein PT944_01560 [Actinomycetaceae bacterium]|nr:hypothetical protein [Arcanobacterium sp.]MDD7686590.1 hypothetical protein [Actinomycetaceae bacterium]MDY5273096.1 hypothetical protein [Arcanobacterium sp.]